MLLALDIRSLFLIDALSLTLQPGFTVITGETGSGKSIVFDALALALGAKASPKEVLKTGASRGSVELCVDIARNPNQESIRALLLQADEALAESLEESPEEAALWISREVTPTGSRSKINGVSVSRELVAQLQALLIDIHGQHELTGLFQPKIQRQTLDLAGEYMSEKQESEQQGVNTTFKTVSHRTLLQQTAQAYQAYTAAKNQWQALQHMQAKADSERSFWQFQFDELSEADLQEADEDERLRQQLKHLSQAEDIIKGCAQVVGMLKNGQEDESTAVLPLLSQLAMLEKRLSSLAQKSDVFSPKLSQCLEATELLRELAYGVEAEAEQCQADPETLQALVDRLDVLEKLKRKYGGSLAQAAATQRTLEAQLMQCENLDAQLQEAQHAYTVAQLEYTQASLALSQSRQALAAQLSTAVVPLLATLAMPHAQFAVQCDPQVLEPTAEGQDSVQFLFSANPGEPLKPLQKVASGGELSRVLLALKTLSANNTGVPTLLFDEIDTGLGGKTAKAVAQLLRGLSKTTDSTQVLAITHQPLLAAAGHQHWVVSKHVDDGQTHVAVAVLEAQADRVAALSAMMADDGTEAITQQWAQDLLTSAAESVA